MECPNFCACDTPISLPSNGTFTNCLVSNGCDAIPLCHFHSFFDVLALSFNLHKSSDIWSLTSLHDRQWSSLCFFCALFFVTSDQPVSHNFLCTHPPSTVSFLITFRCLSVHALLVVLRNMDSIGSNHTPSLNSSRACFAVHFFQ